RARPTPRTQRPAGRPGIVWHAPVGRFTAAGGLKSMNRAEFEASLRQEGYEVREGEIEPHRHRGAHAHEFDARILVLEGSVTLVFETERVTYRPGDSCNRYDA